LYNFIGYDSIKQTTKGYNMKTITKNGWWSVSFDFNGEVSDDTLNHIADCIKKGFTQGEIIEELEVEEVAK